MCFVSRWLLTGFAGFALLACGAPLRAQEVFPDFDLRVDCPQRVIGPPGSSVTFQGKVVLHTEPNGALAASGARAWSISLRAQEGAVIIGATIRDTDADYAPRGFLERDGYEKTELTDGPGNEGVVSAVILSFMSDVTLPPRGDAVILRLEVEAPVPESGASSYEVDFADGLSGAGQPVKNKITYGEGVTRRDDGGENDNDVDVAEPCRLVISSVVTFVRGNTNGDDSVNITDAVFTLDHLFQGGTPLDCEASADINDDAEVNLSDAAYLLVHLFQGGPAPPAPFPSCGEDPTPAGLTCVRAWCP